MKAKKITQVELQVWEDGVHLDLLDAIIKDGWCIIAIRPEKEYSLVTLEKEV